MHRVLCCANLPTKPVLTAAAIGSGCKGLCRKCILEMNLQGMHSTVFHCFHEVVMEFGLQVIKYPYEHGLVTVLEAVEE